MLFSMNGEENLKSIKINGYETVVGKPGEHDEKVRMMAFIKKILLLSLEKIFQALMHQ